MLIYRLGAVQPELAAGTWAAPTAELIGEVRVGARSSIWFGAIIRADNTPIIIGEDSNIQDGSICHSDPGFPLTIGNRVTVGHQAVLHGCTVEDESLVGMGARILNGAVIETGCIIGAGALVTEGKRFRSGSLIVGVPARIAREVTSQERHLLLQSASGYVQKAQRYAAELCLVSQRGGRASS